MLNLEEGSVKNNDREHLGEDVKKAQIENVS
jgi:hypothetical protein